MEMCFFRRCMLLKRVCLFVSNSHIAKEEQR